MALHVRKVGREVRPERRPGGGPVAVVALFTVDAEADFFGPGDLNGPALARVPCDSALCVGLLTAFRSKSFQLAERARTFGLTSRRHMLIGDIGIHPLTDGVFRASPGYFGDHVRPDGHEDLFTRHGMAWLPIGCFLVRTRDRTILVDAGMGPDIDDAGPRRFLIGGQLPLGLRAIGVGLSQITDVVCTHLHSDHCGWLFDLDAAPVFPNATIWFGAGDWHHFVEGPPEGMQDHIRHGLRGVAERGEGLRLVDRDTTMAPGVTLTMTPGHTPGHLCVITSSGQQRAMLLGDAIVCPVQLDEPTWHSMGDVDPELAQRVRDRLFRELEDGRTLGAGAHFPELQFGRVLAGQGRRWLA